MHFERLFCGNTGNTFLAVLMVLPNSTAFSMGYSTFKGRGITNQEKR